MSTTSWPPIDEPRLHTQPFVSIVTPTYNRRAFIPILIECIQTQNYPRKKIEWVIFDDGTDKIEDLLEPYKKDLEIQYISSDIKLNIGVKRNRLNEMARGDIIVTMDDDDYYYPDRISHAVFVMNSKKANIVGSSRNRLYFTDDGSIWEVGPYNPTHATFGTMAYTKEYTKKHTCDETVVYAEEVSFTNSYKEPLVQLDPEKVMLVICHSENTFNKKKLRDDPTPFFRKTSLKLRNLLKNAKIREFYSALK
jgi:glycosyltransferase involved in cell wall biosynthesis